MYKVNDELIEVITMHGRTQAILYRITNVGELYRVRVIESSGAQIKSGLRYIVTSLKLNEHPVYKATKLTKKIYGL